MDIIQFGLRESEEKRGIVKSWGTTLIVIGIEQQLRSCWTTKSF